MEKEASRAGNHRKYVVLHVDDEPEIGRLTELILSSYEDVVVKSATTMEKALDCISTDPPDLILLDIMMAGEVGWDLLSILRDKMKSNVPVVVLTAYVDSRGIPISMADNRFQAVLPKPYDIESLRDIVRKFLPVR